MKSPAQKSFASKIGGFVAIPFRAEAAFWRIFEHEGRLRLVGQVIKWSVRALGLAACAYFLLPMLLLVLAAIAALTVLGGGEGSAPDTLSSEDNHRFFEEEGLRDGLFGHDHYDKEGNRW